MLDRLVRTPVALLRAETRRGARNWIEWATAGMTHDGGSLIVVQACAVRFGVVAGDPPSANHVTVEPWAARKLAERASETAAFHRGGRRCAWALDRIAWMPIIHELQTMKLPERAAHA